MPTTELLSEMTHIPTLRAAAMDFVSGRVLLEASYTESRYVRISTCHAGNSRATYTMALVGG